MNKKLMILALAGLFFISACTRGNVYLDDLTGQTIGGQVKEINMIARQWEFDPATINVNKGDTIRLIVKSVDVAHGIAIPDFNLNVFLSPGKTEVVEFTADRAGTFPFVCSVSCGVGHPNMVGKIVVG